MIARAGSGTPDAGRADGIVCCTAGDEQFALRGADAYEIVRAERIRRSPGQDGAVGNIYVNREMVPVYPLAAALGRPAPARGGAQPGGNHVVVTRGWTGMAGWLVDRIARPSLADDARVMPLPPIVGPVATRWFEGLVRVGDRVLLVLAPANLDPRSPRAPNAGDGGRVRPGGAVGPRDVSGSLLVLMFSSPALPRCGAPRFALSARRIAAIVRSLPITVVPGSARHVRGVVLWRDSVVVPVIDVRAEGDRRPAGDDDRLVVVRCDRTMHGALVAIPIGADVTLHQPTVADRRVEAENVDAPFVAGVFSVAGKTVALLDVEAAVTTLCV